MRAVFFLVFTGALGSAQDFVWAPKKAPDPYTGVHRPHRKFSDLTAAHAKQAEWTEVVVDDDLLRSQWIQRKPGSKSAKMLHPDTRASWIVMGGEVRFTIEGSDPFVAKKGSMVQAPMQTWFSWEVLGEQPALLFETNIAKAATVFAEEAAAPKTKLAETLRIPMPRKPGVYGHNNKPHVTFAEVAAKLESGELKGTQKIFEDDRAAGNFIYGYEKNLPKLNFSDRGHFHTETAEYWLILAGQIRYRIEGQDVFIASEGDVVYVPRNRWHLARWYGLEPACRFAMNGYPNLAHFYDPEVPVPGNK